MPLFVLIALTYRRNTQASARTSIRRHLHFLGQNIGVIKRGEYRIMLTDMLISISSLCKISRSNAKTIYLIRIWIVFTDSNNNSSAIPIRKAISQSLNGGT